MSIAVEDAGRFPGQNVEDALIQLADSTIAGIGNSGADIDLVSTDSSIRIVTDVVNREVDFRARFIEQGIVSVSSMQDYCFFVPIGSTDDNNVKLYLRLLSFDRHFLEILPAHSHNTTAQSSLNSLGESPSLASHTHGDNFSVVDALSHTHDVGWLNTGTFYSLNTNHALDAHLSLAAAAGGNNVYAKSDGGHGHSLLGSVSSANISHTHNISHSHTISLEGTGTPYDVNDGTTNPPIKSTPYRFVDNLLFGVKAPGQNDFMDATPQLRNAVKNLLGLPEAPSQIGDGTSSLTYDGLDISSVFTTDGLWEVQFKVGAADSGGRLQFCIVVS
jgi:hypothetical protein